MATSSSFSLLALLLVVVYAAGGASAVTTHVVGDNQRWDIPASPNYYTDWASKQTFLVGDILVFNFATTAHDVLQVSQPNYAACNIQSPLASNTTGPAMISLSSSGTHYYICGVGSHCSLGQKMTLTVSAASTPTTTPPPPTTPGSTAIPPTASSTPAVPSSPGPSATGTPPSAAPSAGLRNAAIAAVVLTAAATALLF